MAPRLQFQSRTFSLVSVLLFLAIVLGLYIAANMFIRRTVHTIEARSEELAVQVKREELSRNSANLLKGLSKETEELSTFFVHPDGTVALIERIENLGAFVGSTITIGDVSLVPVSEGSDEGMMTMRIESSGSWQEMLHLLSLLDTLPFESEVDVLTLQVVGEGEGGTTWGLRATLRVSIRT